MPPEIVNALVLVITSVTTGGGALWLGKECTSYFRYKRRVAEEDRTLARQREQELKDHLLEDVRERKIEQAALRTVIEANTAVGREQNHQVGALIEKVSLLIGSFDRFNTMLEAVHNMRQHRGIFGRVADMDQERGAQP